MAGWAESGNVHTIYCLVGGLVSEHMQTKQNLQKRLYMAASEPNGYSPVTPEVAEGEV